MKNAVTLTAIIILPFLLLIASFGVLVHDETFYAKLLVKEHDDADYSINLSKQLVSYFKSSDFSKPNIPSLDERERTHLLDTKKTMRKSFHLLALLAVVFVLLVALSEHKSKIFFYGGLVSAAVPLVLALLPFQTSFELLHRMLFASGSWLFPEGAVLVSSYTERFFRGFAIYIFLRTAITGIVIAVLAKLSCK